ncbi:hypothetical protein MVES1_000710 [Malassezia vespertilionis]|uniref:Hxt1p n=1 Tax=Malassezia vespertilionis TaxID=2020962 RepID=A0A2N1JGA2_9BASI|nr:uncharacterized protein MVES1_000710 [Malassezia vespertilionis]PKI85573.1 Hxt1p [Malassezia vespertilionis]WFD05380.1 hypothetical protein MVES1_000710 [Malassezia vespertilionis]
MGGLLFGWDTGQIADLMIMQDFKRRFASKDPGNPDHYVWNMWIQGLIVGFLSIGAMVGPFLGAPASDRFGRRWSIAFGCVVFTVGLIIQVASQYSWVQLGIGRFIVGVSVGWLSASVPVYQSETLPRQVRGAMVGMYQLFITIGILLSYCCCYGTKGYMSSDGSFSSAQWRVPIAVGFAWGIILGVGIMFCPESPRWLGKRGRFDEMKKVLARMRGVDASNEFVLSEFYDIKKEVLDEMQAEKKGWIDCFRTENKTLYRTILGIALQTGQQLTGANYFFYYGATIFQSVGISDSVVTQIILGAVNTGTTFPGLWALDRFGRRICLLVGSAWMAMWLLIFATAGVAGKPIRFVPGGEGVTNPDAPADPESIGTLMICSACFFILAFASTWGPGIWTLISETCAPQTRAKQYAIATLGNWTWNFCIGFFTPPITNNIHFNYGYIFMGCNVANFFLVYFFVYETFNLTLEAANDMYLDPNCKPWNSAKWVPPGYTSRPGFKANVEKELENLSNATGALPNSDNASETKDDGLMIRTSTP